MTVDLGQFSTGDSVKNIPALTTVKYIGKNALNSSKAYKVYKGSYAEQYCKDNNIKYAYVDGTSSTNPSTPITEFPKMEYTKTLGPVTFSNYVSHEERNLNDAQDKNITVTWVRISDKGSMRADYDNTEFILHLFDAWNSNDEKDTGRTDNTFGMGNWTLKSWDITPYKTTKTNGTWSKGLTWQFSYNTMENNNTDRNTHRITIETNGKKYYYYISVVTDKPTGSTTTPTTPTVPTTATATPTASKVMVNGKQISFDAYKINDNNYFKLRDVAQVLRGSEKQFNVTWDETRNAINLISNQIYISVGDELTSGDGMTKQSILTTSTIYKDGVEISLTAYNIGGSNYFKPRDLGQTFDFNVTWDGVNNTIIIDTSTGYMEN